MKIAISIPDRLFRDADTFARRHHLSRSALYAEAVKAYVEQRRSGDVTRQLDEVYANQPSSLDKLLQGIQSSSLPREDWQ